MARKVFFSFKYEDYQGLWLFGIWTSHFRIGLWLMSIKRSLHLLVRFWNVTSIVCLLKDGMIGLFDTTGGIYAKDKKEKAEGLAKYIAVEKKKGKNLFGGVVLQDKNSWRYHDGKKYVYNPNNLKDWKFLNLN